MSTRTVTATLLAALISVTGLAALANAEDGSSSENVLAGSNRQMQ